MVSTLDFESSDPSSNLGGTSNFFRSKMLIFLIFFVQLVHGLNIYIDPNNEIRALKPLWISTGFSPERAKTHERQSNDLLKKETLLNLQLIGSLPRGAIEQVRVHWLLDLMKGPLEMGHLDEFIHALWKSNLRPGFELMGNPGNKFVSNFSGAEIIHLLFIVMMANFMQSDFLRISARTKENAFFNLLKVRVIKLT